MTSEDDTELVADTATAEAAPETELLPPTAAPEIQAAWSESGDQDDEDDEASATSWHLVSGVAVALLVICALTAIAIGVIGYAMTDTPQAAGPRPTTTAETPRAAPPAAEPSTVTATVAPVTVTVTPPRAEEPSALPTETALPAGLPGGWTETQLATSTCNVLWDGGSMSDAVTFVQRISGWDYNRSSHWANNAVSGECPAARTH